MWSSGAQADSEVAANLEHVRKRIANKSDGRDICLIAVSKTKPMSLIAEAAISAGHRDFGENYIQELVEKATLATDEDSADEISKSIRWHFIGRIQSNKAKLLCTVPNLFAVHTVHNEKIANALQKHWLDLHGPDAQPLRVFIQVNTSGEESKGGCPPDEAPNLALAVTQNCPNLQLIGLMCIGKYSGAEGDASPDFTTLNNCRSAAADALSLNPDTLALSMGMSHDFETALEYGATHVRVGSTIFGARVYAAKASSPTDTEVSPKDSTEVVKASS